MITGLDIAEPCWMSGLVQPRDMSIPLPQISFASAHNKLYRVWYLIFSPKKIPEEIFLPTVFHPNNVYSEVIVSMTFKSRSRPNKFRVSVWICQSCAWKVLALSTASATSRRFVFPLALEVKWIEWLCVPGLITPQSFFFYSSQVQGGRKRTLQLVEVFHSRTI